MCVFILVQCLCWQHLNKAALAASCFRWTVKKHSAMRSTNSSPLKTAPMPNTLTCVALCVLLTGRRCDRGWRIFLMWVQCLAWTGWQRKMGSFRSRGATPLVWAGTWRLMVMCLRDGPGIQVKGYLWFYLCFFKKCFKQGLLLLSREPGEIVHTCKCLLHSTNAVHRLTQLRSDSVWLVQICKMFATNAEHRLTQLRSDSVWLKQVTSGLHSQKLSEHGVTNTVLVCLSASACVCMHVCCSFA